MTHKTRLLIVDDEAALLAELKPLLERSGYEVFTAANGEQALRQVQETHPDLIILDVLMPQLNGREVLRRLRRRDDWTPVILLTQVGSSVERALSLQEGADDYLNKPYDPMELIARVEAVLRRTRRGDAPLSSHRHLRSGTLELDRQARQVMLEERTLPLTARAVGVLEYLMLNAGEPVGRERLLDEVWGWAQAVDTRAVDIRIAEIRKHLGDAAADPRYIETVIGHGYRFLGQVEGRR
ncbi:MAG: response regulator transcription factor [Candidatus Promineifilaceae bacterium]|nr:response regulator transcription factor [Candidatus Promineifilaceae bacterium]